MPFRVGKESKAALERVGGGIEGGTGEHWREYGAQQKSKKFWLLKSLIWLAIAARMIHPITYISYKLRT